MLEERGSITVWTSLMMMIIVCFVFVLIEGARINSAKNEALESTKLAAQSVMASYDPNIYEKYGIFIFDRGYGKATVDSAKSYNTFASYINANINPEYSYSGIIKKNSDSGDLLDLTLRKSSLNFYGNIKNDISGYITQAEDYMKYVISDEEVDKLYTRYERKYSKKKIRQVEYIIRHFSSYGTKNVLPNLWKVRVYEIEYILNNKNDENENLILTIDKINRIKENKTGIDCSNYEADDYTEGEYVYYLREVLYKQNINSLYKNSFSVMLKNINYNYGTNIKADNCYIGVTATSSITMRMNFAVEKVLKIANKIKGKKMEFTSKSSFSYL